MAWLAYQVNTNGNVNYNAVLGNDLYYMDDTSAVNSTTASAIGNSNYPFNGIFDGNGFSIYGVSGKNLIGVNTSNSTLKNLTLRNVDYKSVVDTNLGVIENVKYYGKTSYGFAKYNSGTINKCENYSAIWGGSGIAYVNAKNGQITSSRNRGSFWKDVDAYSSSYKFGGVAYQNAGSIDSVVADVKMFGYKVSKGDTIAAGAPRIGAYSMSVGGIVEENTEVGSISNSVANISIDSFGVYSEKASTAYIDIMGGIASRNHGKIEGCRSSLQIGRVPSDTATKSPGRKFFLGGIAGINGAKGAISKTRTAVTISEFQNSNEYVKNYIGGAVGGG